MVASIIMYSLSWSWPVPENPLENAAAGPSVEALIDDLPVAKALGQIGAKGCRRET